MILNMMIHACCVVLIERLCLIILHAGNLNASNLNTSTSFVRPVLIVLYRVSESLSLSTSHLLEGQAGPPISTLTSRAFVLKGFKAGGVFAI